MAQNVGQLQAVSDPHGFFYTLEISYAGSASLAAFTYYLCSDTRSWTINNQLYTQVNFKLQLPRQATDEVPRASIEMDNVGLDLMGTFEALPPSATLTAKIGIRSRATPTVYDYVFVARMSGVSCTVHTVSASIGDDDEMRQPAVRLRYDPTTVPEVFAG